MLEIDPELNTNIGAHEILHPLTKNENFLVYKQRFMNFMLMTTELSDSKKFAMNEFSSCMLAPKFGKESDLWVQLGEESVRRKEGFFR
jgi:hypothetical protein